LELKLICKTIMLLEEDWHLTLVG